MNLRTSQKTIIPPFLKAILLTTHPIILLLVRLPNQMIPILHPCQVRPQILKRIQNEANGAGAEKIKIKRNENLVNPRVVENENTGNISTIFTIS